MAYSKILLVTTGHVGNNIFCTPAIRLLKRCLPSTQFDILAMTKRGASVFERNPDVSRIYQIANKIFIRRLTGKYPLVLDLYREKMTNRLQKHSSSITTPLNTPQHRADEILEAVARRFKYEIIPEDRHYALFPKSSDFGVVQQLLKHRAEDILVGFHVGNGIASAHGWKFWCRNQKIAKSRRFWALSEYIQLAQLLKREDPNIRFVLTGSNTEIFLGKQFVKQIPDTINLMGKTSLSTLALLMHYLRAYITTDTGPLHVASTTPVPIVGLFGASSNPENTGPYPIQPQHTSIKKASMAEILPSEVYMAVLAKLEL